MPSPRVFSRLARIHPAALRAKFGTPQWRAVRIRHKPESLPPSYIAKSEVPIEESGHLSPVTVAKGIEYGVSLLGCFIEGYVGSNQALGKEADFGKMIEAASEFACGTFESCSDELNWHEHFQLLMRHPVINAGVQIAAWHRYRLPEDLLST